MTDVQQGAPPAPPAGWYPDPVRPGSTRYWSGTGWTDQVSTPADEAPAFDQSPFLQPDVAPLGLMFDAGPVVEPPPLSFTVPPAMPETHASQSEWHQTRARPMQRPSAPPVSTTTRVSSSVSRAGDPYDRNWVAGVAIAFAILSVPLVAARVLWDLPPLTQSIFAGAPIGIAILALVRATRHRSGLILSIVALVLSALTLGAAYIVDPAIVQSFVDSLSGLLPA